jgi:RimJ/RimL family protein N-acetyltransferase
LTVPVSFTRDLLELHPDADAFLAERVERNVIASLLVHARAGRLSARRLLFAWGSADDGQLRWLAMRTPDWPLLVTELSAGDADGLMEAWLREDPDVPGVTAVPDATRAVADAWSKRTGGRWRTRMEEALHLLDAVIEPPHTPAGRLRPAVSSDRDLLVAWERAFVADAGIGATAAREAEDAVERRLAAGSAFLWEDAGPVSMLVLSPRIAGTVRIGPVYTPPEHRRRGYASAAVAAACRDALADGARRCMLFTDVANATSNRIYAAIGFRRVADWDEVEFVR